MEDARIVQAYYDENAQKEWERIDGRPEFLITKRFLDRYIRPGQSVLDIGGGPGRYSFYLAEKGCDVTLFDLSEGNLAFAREKSRALGLPIRLQQGDAREADAIMGRQYDHVLLMGPLYHLLEESDRAKAVGAALASLKPGGKLYVSFIARFGGFIYAMKFLPEIMAEPLEQQYTRDYLEGKAFAGDGFTRAFMIHQQAVEPFMAQFPLEKLHIFGQESILSPCEDNIFSQPPEIIDLWLDFAEAVCEKEELLSWSEHIMYIGEKR